MLEAIKPGFSKLTHFSLSCIEAFGENPYYTLKKEVNAHIVHANAHIVQVAFSGSLHLCSIRLTTGHATQCRAVVNASFHHHLFENHEIFSFPSEHAASVFDIGRAGRTKRTASQSAQW
ncbi:MAG: hypothetical protein H6574_13900 [Lewinellaceae bacterium]|nr:hypothetical protein [Lewinellaceae bacterium]